MPYSWKPILRWAHLKAPGRDRLDVLSTLVEAHEARTFPIDLPYPVEAILFRMEQQGLKPKDLEPMIGKRNRVYEVLNRKRPKRRLRLRPAVG